MHFPTLIPLTRRLAWCLIALGVVLQATIRDRLNGVATLFYALPLPVVFALAVALLLGPGGGFRCRRCAAITACAVLAWWSARSWCWHDAPASNARLPGEVRVLFWNLSRPSGPLPSLAELTKRFDPDVIGCTEPCDAGKHINPADWQKMFPGYSVRPTFREMLWFTRDAPISEKTQMLDGLGSCADIHTMINNQPEHLQLVDVWADPLRPRSKQLSESFHLVENDPRAIVMGDFNTPSESMLFDAWRSKFDDAMDAAGRGWRETWAYFVPALSLDHVWAGSEWNIIDCEKVWSVSSDHAALLVRLVPR